MRRRLALLSGLACLAVALVAGPPAVAGPDRETGQVFGGDPAAPGQVPWMAFVTDMSGSFVCGGTLVTPIQVLTAAHCTTDPNNSLVGLGLTDLSGPGLEEGERHGVISVDIHPAYQSGELSFDVALLTLDTAVTPGVATPVRVVDSDEEDLWFAGTPATVAGWGQTEFGETSELQVAQVPIAITNCATAVLCAGDGDPAVCSGDSGGPLTVEGPVGEPVLVGVVSAGFDPCGTTFDLYAAVGDPQIRDAWLEPLLAVPEPEDSLGPRVISKAPTGTGVKRGANATAVLSEEVDPDTVSPFSVRLERMTADGPLRVTNIDVELLADGATVRLDPFGDSDKKLAKKARYRVTVTTFVEDLAGNALDQASGTSGNQQLRWSFTTGRR